MRAAAALAAEIVFFALAFGLRAWIQRRRTGSTGYVLPRRDAPVVELVGAATFTASLFPLAAAPIAELAGMSRVAVLDTAWAAAAGAVLVVVGVAGCLWSQLQMGDSWRIGVDAAARTDLVTGGVYEQVRNPIFTAMIIAVAGLALVVPNVWAIAALVALVAGVEIQVRFVEEPYLARAHGRDYARYAERAGRFVPGVGQLRSS